MTGTTIALTGAALVAFAANSLLCREALGKRAIDPVSFTTIRVLCGAALLVLLARWLDPRTKEDDPPAGSFASAAALFGYAIAFSLAYVSLEAGAGALILFGLVQTTMLVAGLRAGERPRPLQWAGLVVALGGLGVLLAPGLSAPDPLGAGLMAAAGVAWGVYSLRGRGVARPIAATAGNFARAAPLALVATAIGAVALGVSVSPRGALLAAASGALASGVGYAVWYRALRGHTAATAAVVQLAVPVLAAAGGVLLLGERPTARLALASLLVLGGVGTSTYAARR